MFTIFEELNDSGEPPLHPLIVLDELETAEPEPLGEEETVLVPPLSDAELVGVLSFFLIGEDISIVIFLIFGRSSLIGDGI